MSGSGDQVKIVDLESKNEGLVREVAELVFEAFALLPGFVNTIEEALAEVRESFAQERLSRVALDPSGRAHGWAAGIQQYSGNVYELHSLAVRPEAQRHGIGRALVVDFEEQVRRRGAMTVVLGTDDVTGATNLFGVDVYPDVCSHISSIRNIAGHPFEFYVKCGYKIVGLVPDANGFGRPDILMAKRVGSVEGRY